jgi:hypothetical protein
MTDDATGANGSALPQEPKNRSDRQLRRLAARQGLELCKPRWRGAGWWIFGGQRKTLVLRDASLAEVEGLLSASPGAREAVIAVAGILRDLELDEVDATWSLRMFVAAAVRALVRDMLAGKLKPGETGKRIAAICAEVERSHGPAQEAAG